MDNRVGISFRRIKKGGRFMVRSEPTIISKIFVNGKWERQEDLPKELVAEIVEKVITRAAKNIGFDVTVTRKKEIEE